MWYFLSVLLLTLATYFVEEIRINRYAHAAEWQRVLYESIVLFIFAAMLSLIFYIRCKYLGISKSFTVVPVAYISIQRLFEVSHRFQLYDDPMVTDILFFIHYAFAVVFFSLLVYLQFASRK